MMSFQKKFPLPLTVVAALLVLSLAGCDSKSPTAPERPAAAPPPPVTTTVWNITVNASPSSFELPEGGSVTVSSVITVIVRSASNNQPPPDGSTVILSTSVASGVVALQDGTGSAVLTFVATTTGSVEVQASLEGSVGRTSIDVVPQSEEAAGVPLFIERITPDRGSPVGGERVRIIGTGFEEPVRVFFADLPAEIRSVTSTQVVVNTPTIDLAVGSTETVSVTVNINVNDTDAASDTLSNGFTYTRGGSGGGGGGGGGDNALVPRIISVSPTSGPNEGGTQVTINGEGFSDQVQVFFGTNTLIEAPVLSTSASRILVRTPSATGFNDVHQNALVDVVVRNVDSGFEDTFAGAFQYGGGEMFISGVSPSRGVYTGGDNVTLFGQNFEGPAFVQFGGINQNVISVTGTEILLVNVGALITCADTPVDIVVTNLETNESTSLSGGFVYFPVQPFFTSPLNPNAVTIDIITRGLTPSTFTFTAVGVEPRFSVFFKNDIDSDPRGVFATLGPDGITISGDIPTVSDPLPTEVCDDTPEDGQAGLRFIPVFADVTLTNLNTGCFDVLVDAIVYNPSDRSCRDDNAPPAASFSATPNPATLPPLPAPQTVTVFFTDTTTFCTLGGFTCTYSWNFGDGSPLATSQSPSHAYTAPGTFGVTLSITRSDGATSSATVDVTVNAAP